MILYVDFVNGSFCGFNSVNYGDGGIDFGVVVLFNVEIVVIEFCGGVSLLGYFEGVCDVVNFYGLVYYFLVIVNILW